MEETKPKSIKVQVNITATLKDRFLAALEYEGIDQTNFVISKIYEFVCEVEKKKEEQAKKAND